MYIHIYKRAKTLENLYKEHKKICYYIYVFFIIKYVKEKILTL